MATAVAARPQPQTKYVLRPQALPRTRVAFVCLGNSCRSQMAEAWLRHLSGGTVEAVSAGLHPLGFITPETFQVMEEKNVSLEGQRSKGLEAIDWEKVDILVNMSPLGGNLLLPGFKGRQRQWKVADPYLKPLRTYRKVRDQLERKVRRLLEELKAPPVGPASATG
ncbi:MAG: arsenate reductase ArsC [Acidobacteria bacterium]|nr:arsenate reductase ArsC [Acidobacteriota bacterium]